MTKTLLTAAAIAAFGAFGTAAAQDHQQMDHAQHAHDHADIAPQTPEDREATDVLPQDAGRTITVRVNGMVCDFCARSLTKVLRRDDAVEAVAIDLEEKTVTILLTEGGAMDDEAVTEAVLSAGYNVAIIERGDA